MSLVPPEDEVQSDDEQPEEEQGVATALPAGGKNYVTPRGYAALQAEYESLRSIERPQVVETVAWAAGNGDRSENGDYLYGKRRLREIDRRLRYLSKQLARAVVVDPAQQTQRDRVFFGASVRVRDPQGVEQEYQITGVDEADAAAGRISWRSPLACSLLGARVGDHVRCHGPAGTFEWVVLSIRYGDG